MIPKNKIGMTFTRKLFFVLVFLLVFSLQSAVVSVDSAHAVKAGQSCTKAGLKNGSFICTKVKGKLVWEFAKKKQSITSTYESRVSVNAQTTTIDFFSTSKLPVNATSMTPEVCTLNQKVLHLFSIGFCKVRLTQNGNAQYLAAPPEEIRILVYGNNEIAFNPPTSLPLDSNSYTLIATSTSGLPVEYESLTPDVCFITKSELALIKVGYCKIVAVQNGSEFYDPAMSTEATIAIQGSNQISFAPQASLLLSSKTYVLSGNATSGLPLKFSSPDTEICTVSESILTLLKVGVCSVFAAQIGSDLYLPAQSVNAKIVISSARVTSDQVDSVSGFQVKAIYVVPSDGVDHSYDTNGYIAGVLDEGNKFLRAQIGLQIPIDKNSSGYDILFLKSKLNTSHFLSSENLDDELMAESLLLENPGNNRKDYIFFVDVRILVSGEACGYAGIGGMTAIVAIGSECTQESHDLKNYAAHAWPHELMHNFGVEHTLDNPCDFMRGEKTPGTCPWSTPWTLDKERTRYVGSSAQGQDILKLPVWEGYTNRDFWSRCYLNPIPRADGIKYAYCPTGTQTIGALTYCWEDFSSITLEEFLDGVWKVVGPGSHYREPWGPDVFWQCSAGYSAPWKDVTVTTPKIALYRWMRNGVESEQFKVIWVR